MIFRGFLYSHSRAELCIRLLLALMLTSVSYIVVTRTYAGTLPRGAMARAHMLAPQNGQITAVLAQTFLSNSKVVAAQSRSEALAKEALIQDPTAVPAIVTLALNAQMRGQTKLARHFFDYSQTLSRRSLETQIWASEDAVSRNDITSALTHYDIALRTSDVASDLMFPVLASAITDPAIRMALIKRLAVKPNWALPFIEYISSNSPDPRATAKLFDGLNQVRMTPSEAADAALVNALFSVNAFEDAWSFYASARAGANRSMSRDPHFASDRQSPLPFDWTPITDAGVAASIQRGTDGGIFDFSVPAGVSSIILQQVQMLAPGTYQIDGHSTGIDQPSGSHPYWTLMCHGGSEYGRVDVPNSAQQKGMFSGQFTVAKRCPVQILALVVRPSDVVTGVSGQIDEAKLRPIR